MTKLFLIFILSYITNICGANEYTESLPDSIITIEHTYIYCLEDPAKAQEIMDELRQRKTDPEWQLDWCQADLCYNTGKYRLALYYFDRVSKSEEIKKDAQLRMDLLSTLGECYRMNNNTEKAITTFLDMVDIAKELGNTAEIGRGYMFIGTLTLGEKNEKLAEEYFSLAEKYLKESGHTEYLYHYNLTLADLMTKENRLDDAYTYILRAEKGLEEMEKNPENLLMPEGMISYEKGRLYALASEVLAKQGKNKEATVYYKRFMASPCSTDYRTRIYIVPYLLEIKDTRQATAISEERLNILRAETDTIGDDMTAVLKHLTTAHEIAGNHQKALFFAKESIKHANNMRKKDREGTVLELATFYNMQEKESRLTLQEKELQNKNILLGAALIIVILLIAGIGLIAFSMQKAKKQNLAMINQIRELQSYKEKEKSTNRQPMKNLLEKVTGNELFTWVDRKIREEKLYLIPELTRDKMAEMLGLKKNTVTQAINEATGAPFTDYINNLRLEEALHLLNNPEDIKLDIIAEHSGFGSVRSFYRQFKEKYGMSPFQYRKLATPHKSI